jgi:hypothetical protein
MRIRKISKTSARPALIGMGLALILAWGTAWAQSLDIPSKRWGLSFGNSKEFTGLRFNFRDSQVKFIDGVNITLWQPRKGDDESVITGLSFGTLPGGGRLRGVQIGLLGIAGAHSITGVSLAGLGMGAGDGLIGINIAGVGMGAGKNLEGFNIAGLGLGAGENISGVNFAGLGLGAGKDIEGVSIAGLGLGASNNIVGISIAGLGAGAGKNMTGLNIAGLGLGAGENLSGINISGLGLGAGKVLSGVTIAGLAAGSEEIRGLTIAGGAVGGKILKGLQVAGGMVHVIKEGAFYGCAVSPYNYIRGSQTGVSIGIVNYAWTVKGVQLGLVNIVRDNPAGLKVLPVFNTSF